MKNQQDKLVLKASGTRHAPIPLGPHLRLAEALAFLRGVQQNVQRVFRSSELSRVHRERLLRAGFVREVMKDG